MATGSGYASLSSDFDLVKVYQGFGSDSMAITTIPQIHPELVVTGHRDGKVYGHDPRNGSETHTFLLKHPSAVSHVNSINENRIVVAGLDSQLAQYDLRYCKAGFSLHMPCSNRRKSHLKHTTQPFVHYPDYVNEARFNLGFAIDEGTGVIAAAMGAESISSQIKIFSLHEGQVLMDTGGPKPVRNRAIQNVQTMKFVDDSNGRGPKSLMYLRGTELVRYGL